MRIKATLEPVCATETLADVEPGVLCRCRRRDLPGDTVLRYRDHERRVYRLLPSGYWELTDEAGNASHYSALEQLGRLRFEIVE